MTRTFTKIVVCLMTVAITFLCFSTDTQAQVPEDFETFPTGTGSANGWTIDPTTGFRWEAEDATGANENSLDTGPFFDHTVEGAAGGFYMYTEASSGEAGDEANFISPAIDLSTHTCPKLSFWYHMFGADMGELHIDANDGTGWVLDVMPPLLGQQHAAGGDAWLEATGSLAAYVGATAVQIRFRAIRGTSFESDMSIDDVDIIDDTSDDIALTAASTSSSFCDHGDAETITVTVANNSCVDVPANSVDVSLDVTGPATTGPVTETITSIIPAGGSVNHTFAALVDMTADGTYLVDVAAAFNAGSGLTDSNAGNDAFNGGLTLGVDFGTIDGENPAYVESFEAGDGDWTVLDLGGNSNMILGTPPAAAVNINSASDGTQAWFHNGSAYNASEAIFFISGCYDLGCMATGTFSIDINFDSENGWDGASVGYSTDNGATFTRLGDETTGTNWYNDDSVQSQDIFGDTNGAGWTGDCDSGDTTCSGAWLSASHPIDMLAGEPAVLFAVTYTSDASVQTGEGFAWDNVQVSGTTDAACFGCADVGACNYDGSAYDDGVTCEYTSCVGCTDAGACNYDAAATIDDASCDYSCLGCIDIAACNYDASATIDDASCLYGMCGDGICDIACGEDAMTCPGDCAGIIAGCTDITACNYDATATVDDASCEFTSCAGCTNVAACNYDATATIDDSSCIIGSCGNGICEPVCGENATNCNDCLIRLGCTDPLAHNFSPRANQDDGSCETCTDGIMNGDETDIDCGGSFCGPCAAGCTDVDAHNYDATALTDDGSCETCSDGIQNGDETGVDCGGANSNCGPCGDLCINALDIACGGSMSGDTNNNTDDDLPALCSNGIGFPITNPGAGAWYTFVGTGENVVISTDNLGTILDTNLQLFSGDCNNLVCEFSDEDGGGNISPSSYSSKIDFPTTNGVTYYVYVSGFSGAQGAYELTVDCYIPIVITQEAIFPIPGSGGGVGGVSVTVTGGNTDCGPLTYAWSGPGGYTASTKDAADITTAGVYTLVVTDCLGNTATFVVTVPNETRSGRGRKAAVVATADLMATPNPFTNQTMISFEVGTEERVSLEVFDIRGAKVANLFNDTAEAGQNYQVQFGKNIPTGTYIAKLTTTNGEVQHIKLVLTK